MPRTKDTYVRSIPQPTTFNVPTGPAMTTRNSRPTGYTPQTARKLCKRIMNGETLSKICEDPKMPPKRRVIAWLASPNRNDFREMYYYARRVQAEMLMDEVIDIADDRTNDWKQTYSKTGQPNGWKPDNEAIQRSRVRIDTRKWLASKLIPRIYGEKVNVEHGATGKLAELLENASNQSTGLPPPIDEQAES